MMLDWQQLLVYLIGAAAAAYLFWRYRGRRSRARGPCGGCSACPAPTAPERSSERHLVQIEAAPPQPRRDD